MTEIALLAAAQADKPVSGIAAGTVAIWDAGVDGTDFTPAIAPQSHLDKVKFHNALAYKKIARVVTSRDAGRAAVSLPAVATGAANLVIDALLFEHGLDYTPLIIAEIEIGGYRQPVAGTAIPLPGGSTTPPISPRFISLTASSTGIYMHARGWFGPAMTVHWKVWVFAAEFQGDDISDDLIRFTPDGALMAALGPIDTNHRFIRKKDSGSGEIRVIGKQTIAMDVQNSAMVLNYSDGEKSAAVWESDSIPYPAAHYSVTGAECEILGAPVSEPPGWRLEPPMMLVDDDGYKIFDSSQAMLAGLQRYQGSISTDSHAPVPSYTTSFSLDHDIGAAPAGADMIFGWGRVTHVGGFLQNNRPFQFSGTVILDGMSTYINPSWAQIINAMMCVSPVISGGRVIVREHGWSHRRDSSPSWPGITIPSIVLEYDIYAAAFVGGD